MMSAIKRQLIL